MESKTIDEDSWIELSSQSQDATKKDLEVNENLEELKPIDEHEKI